jgi:hypothetical protein
VLTSALACILAGACDDGAAFDVGGPVRLAETTPGLIDSAGAIVFTVSTRESCRTLVDASAGTLEELIDAEATPTKQRIPMFRGVVDDERYDNYGEDAARHTFGAVPANRPTSFVALAVTRDPGPGFSLSSLEGSVFAVGCRSFVPTPGRHHHLPLVLAPVGLR